MIDFAKLSTLLVRIGGAYAIWLGTISLVFSVVAYLVGGTTAMGPDPAERLMVSVVYYFGAALLIAGSRPVGRLLARGL
jgi:hypothetical protein